jgi:hypothetical protein
MIHRRREPRLGRELRPVGLARSGLALQDLQRNLALERVVERLEDRAHAALAQQLEKREVIEMHPHAHHRATDRARDLGERLELGDVHRLPARRARLDDLGHRFRHRKDCRVPGRMSKV